MVGPIINILPFLKSWGGVLLSFAAWVRISLLSGFPTSAIAQALYGAVLRDLSRAGWDISLSLTFYCVFISLLLFYCMYVLLLILPVKKHYFLDHL